MRQPSLRLVALLILMALALPRAASADYPPGDPPETVPFGYVGEVTDYQLRIANVEFDAVDLVRAYDPSVPIITGTSVILIQVEVTYTGTGVGHPGVDMSYTLSDTDGYVHDLLDHACPAWPFPPDRLALTPGQSGRFNLCFIMPADGDDGAEPAGEPGDAAELTVFTTIITDQWPVSFSLDEPASTIDPDVPDCGCASATG